MKDYKSMYHYMCGQMDSAAETLGFATEFLKVSNGIINEITDTNEKNVTGITDILSKVIDDTKSMNDDLTLTISNLSSTINDIVSNNSKSIRELNQLINTASLRFEIIKEHMEKSQEKIEAKMEKEYEQYLSENKSDTNYDNTEEEN